VDLLVEFDCRPVGLFHLSRTQHYLESILGVSKVDLVLRDGIKPALKERILREAIHALRLGFPDTGIQDILNLIDKIQRLCLPHALTATLRD
jgi:hypothetical protein